jgi:hypothetical protein
MDIIRQGYLIYFLENSTDDDFAEKPFKMNEGQSKEHGS